MTFSVRMPDGMVIQGIPEGTSKDIIRAKWVKAVQAEDRKKYSPVNDMTGPQKFFAGMGAQVTGRARSLGNMLGIVGDDSVHEARQRDQPLTETGLGTAGGIAGDVALTALGGTSLKAATMGGAALGLTDPDETELGGRLEGGVKGAGIGLGGGLLGKWGEWIINKRMANAALRKAQNAPRDAALAAGQKLDLRVSPSTSNPTFANRMLESFAGKEAVEQEAALMNAPKMQDAMRKFLGLPESAPMTVDTLKGIHATADQARQAVRGLGRAMEFDDEFVAAITKIQGAAPSASRSFPGIGSPSVKAALAPLVPDMPKATFRQRVAQGIGRPQAPTPKPTFKPEDALDAIKTLREDAAEAFASRQGRVGRAQIKAAKELENLIERNLEKQGLGGSAILSSFRGARVADAKAYAVERIINKATGNVRGAKAAAELAKGTPLTGEMLDVARFASAFGSATKEPTRSAGVNALTTLFGVEAAMLGHPAPLLLPPARLGLGKMMLSKPYQRFMATPRYRPGKKIPRAMKGLGRVAAPAYFAEDDANE